MAMIDYGAIAFKNGKLISTDMFTPMVDTVGWEDTEKDMYHDYQTDKNKPLRLKGNYFAYIGDKDYTIAFYKTWIRIIEYLPSKDCDYQFYNTCEDFGSTHFTWLKWKLWLGGNYIKVTKRNGYLVCKWKYNGDKYKVYFGYGVDFYYYKKWHIVNYYRSPAYRVHQIKRWFKDVIYEWKYYRT